MAQETKVAPKETANKENKTAKRELTLVEALIEVQKELPTLEKNADNPFFKSKYVPLETALPIVLPILNKHGFALVQTVKFIPTRNGQQDVEVLTPALTTRLFFKTGECLEDTALLMIKQGATPQEQGSGITYGKRYQLFAMLGLVGEADDDGNKASMPNADVKKIEVAKPVNTDVKPPVDDAFDL